ncbi:leukotriene B4 receptor 1-like [Periophthalmus magnuspinnatus]|uniref:leukotriene B4 receptor 1-like n=1 Tax=Periophthalmus magnuspinnatus TaxID=409849 RepID=UPI00145AD7D5|nr:leukotriene B4 receptor 1-like [Periophthalmus magnuspinnatus]
MEMLNQTSTNFTNSSATGPPTSFLWASKDLAPAVLLSLCFLVGFPGNIAVLILRPNWQQLSRLTQCLMMNLALSDLLCLVTLPVWIYALLYIWPLGDVACKIIAFIVYCSLYSCLMTITALSVQRYMQVAHQQRCLQFRKRLLALLWLMSMVLSIPALVFRKTIKNQERISCLQKYTSSAQEVAVLLTECVVGFTSLIITTCSYIFLNRRLQQAVFFNDTYTIKLVTTIILTFFILWTPYLTFNIVIVGGILTNNLTIAKFYDLAFVFGSVTFINSGINPLLYAFALVCCKSNGSQ